MENYGKIGMKKSEVRKKNLVVSVCGGGRSGESSSSASGGSTLRLSLFKLDLSTESPKFSAISRQLGFAFCVSYFHICTFSYAPLFLCFFRKKKKIIFKFCIFCCVCPVK